MFRTWSRIQPWTLAPLAMLLMYSLTRAANLAEPVEPVVSDSLPEQPALESYSLSEQRDTLIARWAQGQEKVPLWLALGIAHAEVWNGDSTAVNSSTGALGLFQIHPINFGRYPDCGTPIVNRRVNICYGFQVLVGCIDAVDSKGELVNESLAGILACYGGATRASTRRMYVDAVTRRTRVEWLVTAAPSSAERQHPQR